MSLTRRSVLQAGLGLAAASGLSRAALAGATPAAGWQTPGARPFAKVPAGEHMIPQVEHVVVVMMENHSYDNYFGWLGMNGRGDGFRRGRDGLPADSNPVDPAHPTKGSVRAFHQPNTCAPKAVTQSWDASHVQYDGGRNDGFVVTSTAGSMGYLTDVDLPFYYALGQTFPLCERYFASVMGPTYPNRRFLIAATASGLTGDPLPDPTDFTTRPAHGTIFDRLDAYGITWKDYFTDLGSTMLYPYQVRDNPGKIVPVADFYADAAAGTLPSVCFVEPEYIDGSEEYSNDTNGEIFASSVINAIVQGPAWKTSLIVWCYDEHGGFYDHVRPPRAIRPDGIKPQGVKNYYGDLYSRYGFRVPAAVVSPWSKPNYVSSTVYDHTSILKTVETVWNLPALTHRDANANSLLDCLDLRHAFFADPGVLPIPLVQPSSVACTVTDANTSP